MGLSLLTQVLALAFFIVMAHYAPPSTFGEYAAASVLLGLSGLFTEAGMHAAVIQRSEEELQEAASTAFLANLVGGVGLALLAVAAAPIVGLFFHSRTVGFASAALAATIPFSAASIVPGAMIRRRVSTRLAFVQPVSVIGYGVAGVALLAAGYGLWGLVLATYVATLLSTTSIWMFSRWRPTFRLASMEMWRSLAAYGRPVMISLFLREVGFAGMTAFVGRAFTSTVLGQFRYALRLVTQATSSVTLSAAYVLLPAFTRIYKDERRFAAAVLRALRILTLLVFPITLAFIPLGRPIATTILGKEWSRRRPDHDGDGRFRGRALIQLRQRRGIQGVRTNGCASAPPRADSGRAHRLHVCLPSRRSGRNGACSLRRVLARVALRSSRTRRDPEDSPLVDLPADADRRSSRVPSWSRRCWRSITTSSMPRELERGKGFALLDAGDRRGHPHVSGHASARVEELRRRASGHPRAHDGAPRCASVDQVDETPLVLRLLGTLLVLVGFALAALDHESWDFVVVTLSTSHGLHVTDFVGSVLLWSGSRSSGMPRDPGDGYPPAEPRRVRIQAGTVEHREPDEGPGTPHPSGRHSAAFRGNLM